MPPRHAYWTILVDNQATAFRAHEPDELLPTLNRLKATHASVEMKWFERGRLFDSREQARRELQQAPAERRDRSWRPGGDHRDPRQKYRDARKAKWQRFKQKIRARHERRLGRAGPDVAPPHGDPLEEAALARPRAPRGSGSGGGSGSAGGRGARRDRETTGRGDRQAGARRAARERESRHDGWTPRPERDERGSGAPAREGRSKRSRREERAGHAHRDERPSGAQRDERGARSPQGAARPGGAPHETGDPRRRDRKATRNHGSWDGGARRPGGGRPTSNAPRSARDARGEASARGRSAPAAPHPRRRRRNDEES
jgi:hypothetical protein